MLPAAVAHHGRHGNRGITAHRADEEPSGCSERTQRGNRRGSLSELVAQPRCHQSGVQGCARGPHKTALCGAGVAQQRGQPGVLPFVQDFVLRHRRGALYIGVGSRLPPRIPQHTPYDKQDWRSTGHSAHGYSHRQGAHGHKEESGHSRRKGVQELVQPR